MNFIIHAAIAIVIVLTGAGVSNAFAGDGTPAWRYCFGAAALVAQGELFSAALYLRSRSAKRFDMTIAAETLVALGVFSLIVGIVLAVFAARTLNISPGDVTISALEPLLTFFAQGLLASAAALLLATLLRQVEVIKYGQQAESNWSGELERLKQDADSAARALWQLQIEAEAATHHTASLALAVEQILASLNEVAADINSAKEVVPTTLSSVAHEIGNAGTGVSASLKNMADSVTSAAESAKTMAEGFSGLNKEAHASAGMLKRLQELTDSVTNFIRPEKP